jgi:hypothetical protein
MFKVSPACLQTFIDTQNCVLEDRVQYSTVRIPNVFCEGHLLIINFVGTVRIHRLFDHPVFVSAIGMLIVCCNFPSHLLVQIFLQLFPHCLP